MKHKHYHQILAYANNWKIELKTESGIWIKTDNPCFYGHRQYRIVPDEDGWIPWYPHEQSECPVDPEQMVEVEFADNPQIFIGRAKYYVWIDDGFHNVICYRLHKIENEYADLKEAYKHGETIQIPFDQGWVDTEGEPSWSLPAEQYRVKPKTRKLYQWIIKDNAIPEEPYYYLTEMFYETRDELEEFLITKGVDVFQKADWTMIEEKSNEY